jgi:group I intron endonuclease
LIYKDIKGASAPLVYLLALLITLVYYVITFTGGYMARGIYKIINVINNKFYVGSAVDFTVRKRKHWWQLRKGTHRNKHLQAAWNKYGEQSFTFVIVEEFPFETNILVAENVWLKEHVGKDYCYNIATDATAPQLGMYGEKNAMWGKTFSHTEEAKAKISAASAERVQTEEEKAKRRKSMRGHHVSASTKAKISASLSGEGNFWYGKKRPEFAAKVSKTVFSVQDGILFPSLQIALRYYDIKMPTLRRALLSGKPISRGKLTGHTFKYGGLTEPTEHDLNLIKNRLATP